MARIHLRKRDSQRSEDPASAPEEYRGQDHEQEKERYYERWHEPLAKVGVLKFGHITACCFKAGANTLSVTDCCQGSRGDGENRRPEWRTALVMRWLCSHFLGKTVGFSVQIEIVEPGPPPTSLSEDSLSSASPSSAKRVNVWIVFRAS
jgi:hypothetical protein